MTQLSTPRPLSIGHFVCVGSRGFGDPYNSYAHSCAWFDGHVYIGTTRYTMPLWAMKQSGRDMKLSPFPVLKIPYEEMDLRGQIWRYDPAVGQWELAYRAPWDNEATRVPLALSFRSMCVFQGANDAKPALYVIATQGLKPSRRIMLRSDGESFTEIPQPVLDDEYGKFRSFRGLIGFKGRLFAAPSGLQSNYAKVAETGQHSSHGTAANVAQGSSIRCSSEPVNGNWERSSLPDMGDASNNNLYDMGVCGDYLYVGTMNVRDGFQLWRTTGEGPTPHHWEKVLDRGADRGPLNQMIISFAEFRGSLYCGTAIQNGGYDKQNNIGPAGAEIIRFNPDGTWDLVVGDPRRTRQGFKVPTSGLGAGFGSVHNGYIWRLTVHDDVLYAGTAKISTLLPYIDGGSSSHVRRMRDNDPAALERMLESRGGAELWRSSDGDTWVPVTINGFDNRYNGGFRSILSTPAGLFVGTVNMFGAHTAQSHPGGWRYDENPRGGVEVFLGSNQPSAIEHPATIAARDDDASAEFLASGDNEDFSDDGLGLPPDLELLCQGAIEETGIEDMTAALISSETFDPFERLAMIDIDLETVGEAIEDDVLRYFQNGRLRNVGYGQKAASTPRQAALSLISELTATTFTRTPAEQSISALLLGPNSGAVATELMRMRKNIHVTVLVDDRQRAKEVQADEPRAKVLHSRNSVIPAADRSFDLILDVESTLLLGGAKLVRELVRVARPGCGVAAAHLLVQPHGDPVSVADHLTEYRTMLTQAGFAQVLVVDVLDRCWRPFFDHSRTYFRTSLLFDVHSKDRLQAIFSALPGGNQAIGAYLLVYASANSPSLLAGEGRAEGAI